MNLKQKHEKYGKKCHLVVNAHSHFMFLHLDKPHGGGPAAGTEDNEKECGSDLPWWHFHSQTF